MQYIVMVIGISLVVVAWAGYRKPGARLPSFPFGRFPMPWKAQTHLKGQGVALNSIGFVLVLAGAVWNLVVLVNPGVGSGPPAQPGRVFAQLPAAHIPDSATYDGYNGVPPTSGPHYDRPLPWGIYTEAIPNELQVHNLELGGVLIQYNTQDGDLIAELEAFAEKQTGYPCNLIVGPYPDMEPTIAITAWTHLDTMENYDEDRLQVFVDAYRNNGPERVPCRQ